MGDIWKNLKIRRKHSLRQHGLTEWNRSTQRDKSKVNVPKLFNKKWCTIVHVSDQHTHTHSSILSLNRPDIIQAQQQTTIPKSKLIHKQSERGYSIYRHGRRPSDFEVETKRTPSEAGRWNNHDAEHRPGLGSGMMLWWLLFPNGKDAKSTRVSVVQISSNKRLLPRAWPQGFTVARKQAALHHETRGKESISHSIVCLYWECVVSLRHNFLEDKTELLRCVWSCPFSSVNRKVTKYEHHKGQTHVRVQFRIVLLQDSNTNGWWYR